ncbi:MAG: 30S ribosomal protein S14 [Sumerlaeia bacterium]
MAKTSQVARNKKRIRTVEHYRARRAALKAIIKNASTSPEEAYAAQRELQSLPRDASPTRIKNRCVITGRARSYIRDFGLCRHQFRALAHQGQLPGVTKSSW